MYRKILVPLDGSATAERGFSEALRLAEEQKSTLHLLHVIDDFPMLMEMASVSSFEAGMRQVHAFGDKLLAAAQAAATARDVHTETSVREVTHGRIADVVIDEARACACDLIVMGTHGRRGVSRLALGSDAELVVRDSPVPVLLVRAEAS